MLDGAEESGLLDDNAAYSPSMPSFREKTRAQRPLSKIIAVAIVPTLVVLIILNVVIAHRASKSPVNLLPTDVQTTHHSVYLVVVPDGAAASRHVTLASPSADLVISCFKEPCERGWKGDDDDSRVEFIYHPHSTWTEARNRLLAQAQRREVRLDRSYLFYTFMDSDFEAEFDLTKDTVQEYLDTRASLQQSRRATWDYYEGQLTRYLPALASPVTVSWSTKPFGNESVTSTFYMDARVNTFHRLSLLVLLPYATDWDARSWHASQAVLLYRARCIFGAMLQFNGLVPLGGRGNVEDHNEHAPYPREDPWLLANSGLDRYLPVELRAMGQPDYSDSALSPFAFARADWYSAIPDSCRIVSLDSMEHSGYDFEPGRDE